MRGKRTDTSEPSRTETSVALTPAAATDRRGSEKEGGPGYLGNPRIDPTLTPLPSPRPPHHWRHPSQRRRLLASPTATAAATPARAAAHVPPQQPQPQPQRRATRPRPAAPFPSATAPPTDRHKPHLCVSSLPCHGERRKHWLVHGTPLTSPAGVSSGANNLCPFPSRRTPPFNKTPPPPHQNVFANLAEPTKKKVTQIVPLRAPARRP